MKKLAILALGFIFSLAVSAQDQTPVQTGEKTPRPEMGQGNRPQMSAQARAERLAKQLELTDAQKAQVQALYEKQDADRKSKQGDVQKSREEMRAQFDADRKAQDTELEKIIGTEKLQKMQAIRAERMKQRGENGQNAPRPQPQN
jgi:Spy/CpxP family protein refolding chaperone